MANLLNRHTLEFVESVDQTDFHRRTGTNEADWIRNPDLSAVAGVPRHLWKMVNGQLAAMTSEEFTAKAAAEVEAEAAREAAANPERTAVRAALAAIESDAAAWEAIKDTATNVQVRVSMSRLWSHVRKMARYLGKV